MNTDLTQQNIPSGWKQVALGDLVSVTTGSRDANHGSPDGQYPFFTCAQKVSKIDNFSFDTEAVLIAGNGDFNVKYYKGKFDAYQRTYVLSDFQDTTGLFVYQKAKQALNDIMRNNQGSSVKFIKMGDLTDYGFILPPINEQQKIAEILGAVDEDIAKTQEVIEATEKLKRGLMQQLFTRGIGHTKLKETKIGQIPEEWSIKTFEEFAVLQRGFDLPVQDRTIGQYDLVTSNGVTDKHNQFKVKAPGVVTGRSGTLGNVFYIEGDFWPLNTTLYIKDFHGNHEKFVYYKIQSFDMARFGTGTGVPTLNRNNVHKELIAIPKYSEQKEIAEVITAIDEKISVNKKLKAKLTLLKKGLMQDLLSGEVRTI